MSHLFFQFSEDGSFACCLGVSSFDFCAVFAACGLHHVSLPRSIIQRNGLQITGLVEKTIIRYLPMTFWMIISPLDLRPPGQDFSHQNCPGFIDTKELRSKLILDVDQSSSGYYQYGTLVSRSRMFLCDRLYFIVTACHIQWL